MVRLPFNWAGSTNDPDAKKPSQSADTEQKLSLRNLKNYYHILAVARNASTEEIEQAYTRMLEKYGPHVSISECDPEMQIKMLGDIKEAYRVLMNPSKRKVHDATLVRQLGKEDLHELSKKMSKDKKSPESSD